MRGQLCRDGRDVPTQLRHRSTCLAEGDYEGEVRNHRSCGRDLSGGGTPCARAGHRGGDRESRDRCCHDGSDRCCHDDAARGGAPGRIPRTSYGRERGRLALSPRGIGLGCRNLRGGALLRSRSPRPEAVVVVGRRGSSRRGSSVRATWRSALLLCLDLDDRPPCFARKAFGRFHFPKGETTIGSFFGGGQGERTRSENDSEDVGINGSIRADDVQTPGSEAGMPPGDELRDEGDQRAHV